MQKSLTEILLPNCCCLRRKCNEWTQHCSMQEGQIYAHDNSCSECPFPIGEKVKDQIDEHIKQNEYLTLGELREKFLLIIVEWNCDLSTIYQKIVLGKSANAVRWPHKKHIAALMILLWYNKDSDTMLDYIVTGDETWMSYFTD